MASNAHRFNGDSPLAHCHGGTANAARLAVQASKRARYEAAKMAASEVLERAQATAFSGRKDRLRVRRCRDTPSINARQFCWEQSKGLCHYCHYPMIRMANEGRSFTLDHRVPRCRGGSNGIGNLVAACAACNNEKGELTDKEYFAVLEARR